MDLAALSARVGDLAKAMPPFSEELRLALHYGPQDPASSLTKIRLVLERLLVEVYTHRLDREPPKPLAGEVLAANQSTRTIERRILSRMNAVRDMGNLGAHGEPVQPSDAARALIDLCEILDWHRGSESCWAASDTHPELSVVRPEGGSG